MPHTKSESDVGKSEHFKTSVKDPFLRVKYSYEYVFCVL